MASSRNTPNSSRKQDIGGIADRVPDRVYGHISGAFDRMKAMQPTPLGAFPSNKNARNAIWNKLLGLDRPEQTAIMKTMAKKAGHQPDESPACDLCKFVMEHLPDVPVASPATAVAD